MNTRLFLTATLALSLFTLSSTGHSAPQWLDCDKEGAGATYVALDEGTLATANPGDPVNGTGGTGAWGGDPGGGTGPTKFYINPECILVGVGPGAGDPPIQFLLADQVDFNTLKMNLMDANILGHAGNLIFHSDDGLEFRPFGTDHCTLKLEGFDADSNGMIEGNEIDGREIHPDGTIVASEWVVPSGSILLRDANCSCSILTPSGDPITVNVLSTYQDNAGSLPYLERGFRLNLSGSLYRIEPHLAPSDHRAMRPDGTILMNWRTMLLRTGQQLRRWLTIADLVIQRPGTLQPRMHRLPPLPNAFLDIFEPMFPSRLLILPGSAPTLHIPGDCILKTNGTLIDMQGNVIEKPDVPSQYDAFWLDLDGTMYRQVLHVRDEDLPMNPTLREDGSIPLNDAVLLKHNGDRWLPGPAIQEANGKLVLWDGSSTGGRKVVYVPKGVSF